jgi:hypothetical protein
LLPELDSDSPKLDASPMLGISELRSGETEGLERKELQLPRGTQNTSSNTYLVFPRDPEIASEGWGFIFCFTFTPSPIATRIFFLAKRRTAERRTLALRLAMQSAKTGLEFEFWGTELKDWPYIVSEEIGRSRCGTYIVCKSHAGALVAAKISFDSNHTRKVITDIGAAAVERMAAEGSAIFRIEAEVGIIAADFRDVTLLRKNNRSHQQNTN